MLLKYIRNRDEQEVNSLLLHGLNDPELLKQYKTTQN